MTNKDLVEFKQLTTEKQKVIRANGNMHASNENGLSIKGLGAVLRRTKKALEYFTKMILIVDYIVNVK